MISEPSSLRQLKRFAENLLEVREIQVAEDIGRISIHENFQPPGEGVLLFVVDSRLKTVICHKSVQSDF